MVAKRRRVIPRELRKAIGQQLRYLRRNLRIIETLKEEVGLKGLSRKQYRNLLVIGELYRQQEEMYRKRTNRVDDRIVSLSQLHIRPIVREKSRVNVEFGAKVGVSLVYGFARLERLEWDNFHDGRFYRRPQKLTGHDMSVIRRRSWRTKFSARSRIDGTAKNGAFV